MKKGTPSIGLLVLMALAYSTLFISSCNRSSSIDILQKDSFIKYYGGGKTQMAGKVLQTSDGGYLVVGSSNSLGLNDDFDQYVVKTDANGNQLWSKTFGGRGDDFARDVKINPDGSGYILFGDRSFPYPSLDRSGWSSLFNVRKIGLNGNSLGSYYFGDTVLSSTPRGRNSGISMAISNTEIFFSGNTTYSSSAIGNLNMYIGRCDFNGNLLGRVVYGYAGSLSSNTGIALENPTLSSGNVLTSQNTNRPDKATGVVVGKTLSTDMDNNSVITSSPAVAVDNFGIFGGILNQDVQYVNDLKMVQISGQNLPVITGMRNNKPFITILKSDFNGKVSDWFDINLNLSSTLSVPKAIAQTSDGGFVITGYFQDAANSAKGNDVFIAKLSTLGNVQWSKSFGGTGNDEGVDVIQTTDGGYLISANISFGTNNNVIGLIKVKSDGSLN